MDKGRINYFKNTEGHRVSQGDSNGEGTPQVYLRLNAIGKAVKNHFQPYKRWIDLQSEIPRVGDTKGEFEYLIDKRLERIKGEKKIKNIEAHINDDKMILAVKEILR